MKDNDGGNAAGAFDSQFQGQRRRPLALTVLLSGFAMMLGEVTTQKAAKEHTCWWCGELIFQHETYVRWVWKASNDLLPIKVHEECREAWTRLPSGENEVEFSEFSRGCTCERDRCKCPDAMNYWSR